MIGLALAYLRDRLLTTALNVALLALAVATLVILLSFTNQAGQRLERDAEGIDLVVGAKGSPLQLILSSIYHIDAPTGNIPLDSIDLLRSDPAVKSAIPLALGDNFRGFRIVGTEASYLNLYGAKLTEGRMFAKEQEVVIGAEVAQRLHMKLGQAFVGSHGLSDEDEAGEHAHSPFTNVGILAPTGTVLDRLILTPVESVWVAHGIAHEDENEEAHEHHDDDAHGSDHDHDEATAQHQPQRASLTAHEDMKPEITALLVTYNSAYGAVRIPSLINRQTEMQAAVPATETARLLGLLGIGFDGIRLFAWLMALAGGLSIFVALLNAAQAREGDLALLRVMGARRAQVGSVIVAEALITAALGALFGLVLGHGAIALATAKFAQLGEMGIVPWHVFTGEFVIVGAVLCVGIVAALIPAWRVYNEDIAATLARTN